MTDFSNPVGSITDMVTGNPGINMGTTGSMRDTQYASDDLWNEHDAVLRQLHPTRSYASADRPYEHYQPAYRYGSASATQHAGREWHEVEGEMAQGWDRARGASTSGWQEVKDAAHDAWDHVRGHGTGGTGATTATTIITPR